MVGRFASDEPGPTRAQFERKRPEKAGSWSFQESPNLATQRSEVSSCTALSARVALQLIHPNVHVLGFERPELRDQRHVRGIAAKGNVDAPASRLLLCRVEGVPTAVDESLEPGVQIHGVQSVEIADHH